MDQFDRTELKLILKGLQVIRDEMLDDIMSGPGFVAEDSEYNKLVRLQDRIKDAVESRFY
jgi:hypothetical protein